MNFEDFKTRFYSQETRKALKKSDVQMRLSEQDKTISYYYIDVAKTLKIPVRVLYELQLRAVRGLFFKLDRLPYYKTEEGRRDLRNWILTKVGGWKKL